MLAILLIPAALCYTFGTMVGDTRQGWARARGDDRHLRAAARRRASRPSRRAIRRSTQLGVDQAATALQPGGNMEGKEVRFGIAELRALGDRHDRRLERLGQLDARLVHAARRPGADVADAARRGRSSAASAPASTACSMFAIIAVFIAGLMVGRTPEYLGKKIEAYEMKMASLVDPRSRRSSCWSAPRSPCVADGRRRRRRQSRPRTASPRSSTRSRRPATTTAARSPACRANTPFYNTALGICDVRRALLARSIPVLAIAGSLAAQEARARRRAGTLPTHTPLFVALLVGVVLIVGALTFVPALALGPDRRAPAC